MGSHQLTMRAFAIIFLLTALTTIAFNNAITPQIKLRLYPQVSQTCPRGFPVMGICVQKVYLVKNGQRSAISPYANPWLKAARSRSVKWDWRSMRSSFPEDGYVGRLHKLMNERKLLKKTELK